MKKLSLRKYYATHIAKNDPKRLEKRLLKYCSTKTPEKEREKGIVWGEGQMEIALSDREIWRGQIKSHEVKIASGFVSIKLHLDWYARKRIIKIPLVIAGKVIWESWDITWKWEEIIYPATTEIDMYSYYQEHSHPRRLFFTTVSGEKGFFTHRTDPENPAWKDGAMDDPLLKKKS